MYIQHKDYVAPEVVSKTTQDVKEAIRTFIGTSRKSYEDIVKHIQTTTCITNDDIVRQIEEVKLESNYIPVVEEINVQTPEK